MHATADHTPTADREITIVRTFDAPRALVFEAWTRHEHLARWWGPNGFSITTESFAFVVGGTWRFTMHGPDGTDYPNRVVYAAIERPSRIAYANYGGGTDPVFESTITFEESGGRTTVSMRALFPTAEAREHAVKHIGAIEGGQQTLGRLAEEVKLLAARPRVKLERTFSAPRRLVWKAWSTPEHFSRWFAPEAFTMPSCELELRDGGPLRFVFRGPDGGEFPFEGSFVEVVPEERIVFFGRIHDDVYATTTVLFEDRGASTALSVEQVYSRESPATQGAPIGWGQTLDHLQAYVAQL